MYLDVFNVLISMVSTVATVLAAWISAINAVQVNKQMKLGCKQTQLDMRISIWQRTNELIDLILDERFIPDKIDGVYYQAPAFCCYLIGGHYDCAAMVGDDGCASIETMMHVKECVRELKTQSLKASLIFSGDAETSLTSFINAYDDLVTSLDRYCFVLRAMQAANERMKKPLGQYQASFNEPERREKVVSALKRAKDTARLISDDRHQKQIIDQIRLDF